MLIASSENAIRGLLMHLCDIPEDRISEVEIPTGLPLIYDVKISAYDYWMMELEKTHREVQFAQRRIFSNDVQSR